MPESQIRRLITSYFERGELEPIVTLCESHYQNMQRAESESRMYLDQIRVLNSHQNVISPSRQAGLESSKTHKPKTLESEPTQNLEDLI